MPYVETTRTDVAIARVICEAVIMLLVALEPVKNPYLKKFVQRLLVVFVVEEFVLIAQATALYLNILGEWTAIWWRVYEIIRLFISASLCYPMSLFIGENGVKLVRLFVVVIGLVVIGGISDHLHYNEGNSGLNFIAFMLIFLFTYYQITALRRQTQGEVPRLNSLMVLELVLIVLNGLLLVLFYSKGYRHPLLAAIKITIGFLQYHKIYLIISVMTYFE